MEEDPFLDAFISKQLVKSAEPELPMSNIQDSDLQKILRQSYLDALKKVSTQIFQRQFISNFMDSGNLPVDPNDSKVAELLSQASSSVVTKPPFMLVTINIRPGVTFEELDKKVQKFTRKKTVPRYFYVYEVRGPDDAGIHCHALVQYAGRPYDFRRSTKNTFKTVCDVNNPQILNFKFVDSEHLGSKIDYLMGEKKDSKLDGVEHSKNFRAKYSLEPFYESNPPLPCRVALIQPPQSPPPVD